MCVPCHNSTPAQISNAPINPDSDLNKKEFAQIGAIVDIKWTVRLVKFMEQIEKLDGTELKYKGTVKTLILLHYQSLMSHTRKNFTRKLNF